MEFRQLNCKSILNKGELESIAKLIYQTDKFIYPDMFGSEEIAAAVLPNLFKIGADTMFCLDNLFICKIVDKIVAVILWYEGRLCWTKDLLETERSKLERREDGYRDCNLTCHGDWREQLNRVSREYISKYDNPDSDVITLLNVCVDPAIRGQGIGKKMLKAFLSQHDGKDFELCVLSDNQSAIALYKSCGFDEAGEEPAYPPEMGHTRKIMKREENGGKNHAAVS